jgi:hypothetical protein
MADIKQITGNPPAAIAIAGLSLAQTVIRLLYDKKLISGDEGRACYTSAAEQNAAIPDADSRAASIILTELGGFFPQ